MAESPRPQGGVTERPRPIRAVLRLGAPLTLIGLTAWLSLGLGAALPASGADQQWTAVGALPGQAPAFSVAFDPVQPSTMLAATLGAGLVRSDDGRAWRDVGGGVLPKRLWKVALDPSRGPAGTSPVYVGSAGKGFYRSDDGGATWKAASQGLSGDALNVRAIALGRGVIVIGTSDGVWKSADNGATWKAAGLSGMDVSAVAFAQYGTPGAQPPVPAVIVATIDGLKTPGGRVVRSPDLGANWTVLKSGLPSDLVAANVAAGPVAAGGIRPLYIAGSGGVYKSDDIGDDWAQQAGLPQQGFGVVLPSPIDPNIVYAASDGGGASGAGASPGSVVGGVWRSTDRGGSWTKLDGGLTQHGVIALAVSRAAPATLGAIAYNPDGPVVQPFTLLDASVAPSGTPEGGVCPEAPTCQPGDPAPLPPVSGAPVVAVNPDLCPSPSPSPRPSPRPSASLSPGASPSTASPSPSPPSPSPSSASPGAGPSGSPSPSASPCGLPVITRPRTGGDLPLPLVGLAILVLGGILAARIVTSRR